MKLARGSMRLVCRVWLHSVPQVTHGEVCVGVMETCEGEVSPEVLEVGDTVVEVVQIVEEKLDMLEVSILSIL